MLAQRFSSKTAAISFDIYVLGGNGANGNITCYFEIYSEKIKNWKYLTNKRVNFSVCSFMQCVYVVSGVIVK